MSSDEDSEHVEGLPWDAWLAATRAHPTSHRLHIAEIGFDAASMPSQKAVCYGYYPSIEVNSMLLVKCKHCGMLLKDVGFGHHMRSRHGFRAESPASSDECQSFLLSPPHHIPSPRLNESAILSPPYRKPSTSYQMSSAVEDRAASLASRTISPRYSIEQRDDLKLSLRVSRREMPIENGPEVPICEGDVKSKPATADSSKQVNGRVKQKKKKKRKRDSSEEDHISLEHLRRKKRLEAQKPSCTETAPCTSSALHLETSTITEKEVGVATERSPRLRSPASVFSLSSRVPVTSSLNEDSHATAVSASNTISRLSPLAVGDASRAGGTLLTNSPRASPRPSTNLLTASLHSASSREQSASLSTFEAVSPEPTQGQDSSVVQRFRRSPVIATGRSAISSVPRRMPLECALLTSPNQHSMMLTSRANTTSMRSPIPHLSSAEQKSFLISPAVGSLTVTSAAYGSSIAVAAPANFTYAAGGDERQREDEEQYSQMRAMVNGLKGEYEERDVDETLAPEEQAQEVGNEFANAVASTMRLTAVASMSDDEHIVFEDEMNENGRNVIVPKLEVIESSSSSASVVALSPEGQHSEMEVEDVLLREEESEEELDASLSLPPTLTREQPFVAPPLQHRRTHIFLTAAPPYRRVHRSCSSPPSGDSSGLVAQRDFFSQRRHEDWKYASTRMMFARALGVPLNYPPPARSSPPAIVSASQSPRSHDIRTKMEVISPIPSDGSECRSAPSRDINNTNEFSQVTSERSGSEIRCALQQGRTRVSPSEALVATTVDGSSAAVSSSVSISADSANRLQSDTSFRLPTTTFNTNAAAMRGASTLNGMAIRGFEQQQLNGTRVYRAVRGMLRKGGTPTSLSSLHTSPQQHQSQARYLYVHTSTPSPTTASSESASIFASSDAGIGTDIMECDEQQLDVIQSSQKRSNGRLLRQISTQRLYDLPSILKMRVSLHQPIVANEAVLTTVTPLSAYSSPRLVTRQTIESSPILDGPPLFASPTITTRAYVDNGRAGRNTHSYAISSAGACVNRGAVLLSKGVQGLTTTQRGLPIVQSFRRAHRLIANRSVKAFTNGVGGASGMGTIALLGRPTTTQAVIVDQHRGSATPSTTASNCIRSTTALAGIRTGPRTVTVVPVLSRYSPANASTSSPTLTGGATTVCRSSSQSIASAANASAACLSKYAAQPHTC
uniref:C2H2-type domain-containing protein n=2 Tax=Parascaris univalens TaxID=6257 RepID=A0A915BEQ9_PARUN